MSGLKGKDHGRPGYWRSLEALAGSESYRRHLGAEFLESVPETVPEVSRRRFLQVMSASIALASISGCRWPEEQIVPFGERPPGYVPGGRTHFATALELGGIANGLLVTSQDGRPVKVEGNPQHPTSRGAASVYAQASLLGLYDPDRSKTPRRRSGGQVQAAAWKDFGSAARQWTAAMGSGRRFAVIARSTSSPSVKQLRSGLRSKYGDLEWVTYEPVFDEAGGMRAHLDLEAARIIVTLDSDLLVEHPNAVSNARQFVAGRRPDRPHMNRLYAFEPGYSATGAMADHRIPMAAGDLPALVASLAVALFDGHGLRLPSGLRWLEAWRHHRTQSATIEAIARDLLANQGHGLLVAGPRQPREVHELCLALNRALGNTGRTVVYEQTATDQSDRPDLETLGRLVGRMRSGEIEHLLILGGNPVYDAPVDLEFVAALGQVPNSVHLGEYFDETARACSWHLPMAHALESWDLSRAFDGSLTAVQPLIAPLYAGKTMAELLSLYADPAPRSAYEVTKDTFHELSGGAGTAPENDAGFDERWHRFLHDGFLANSATVPGTSAAGDEPRRLPGDSGSPLGPENLELVLTPDRKLYDGRFANNAWLQELPDALSKLTWDNAALVSPALAEELRVRHGEVVTLGFHGRQITLPIYVLPGQAHYSVSVALGYGRTAAGRVGDGIGQSAYQLRTTERPWGGPGLTLTPTGETYPLAVTQDHHAIDERGSRERERRAGGLVRQGTLAEYRENPKFAEHLGTHHPPLVSMWSERESQGHRWGMAIDLNRCNGCNACIVACQSENNIPVVGKEQVANGREMHWLRLDRYFRGDPADPKVAQQPMACVHCELAPCEQVCPVAATLHNDEGLNIMVYNRCVGTRYCSNNCPYKVRRFNFFNYQKGLKTTEKMAFNPEVTVRSRGVMEKCTFCVQRIERARIEAKNAGRAIRDGDIVPACAQTCPAGAIVFGDLNDSASRVAQAAADQRAYALLAELNIKPRTVYLAQIRNPNPALAAEHGEHSDAGAQGAHGAQDQGDHH